MEKLIAGIFDDSQVGEIMKNPMFDEALSEAELSSWHSLNSVVTNWETTGVLNTRRKSKSY